MEYKKYEKDGNISFSFGAFPTYELLKSDVHVIKLVVHEKLDKSKDTDKILALARQKRIPIVTSGSTIEKLSGKGNVYIMGVFKKFDKHVDNTQNQVLLVNPSDMGNLGTIIRVMLGFGYKNLSIIRPCIDIFDPRVIRSSMGAIFSMNIELFDSIEDYLKVNHNALYPFMLKARTTLQKFDKKTSPHTLIFGNEASGLDDSYLELGTPILIKHSNLIDSLNLSMSVGIACYEFSKKD